LRFFFDHNLSPHPAHAIRELCRPDGHEAVALRDKFAVTTADPEGLSAPASEGDRVVVSHDRLTKGSLERAAVREAGLTTFFLARGWRHLDHWDKAYHLVRWWPTIMDIAGTMAPGAAFEVPVRFSGKGRLRQVQL